MRYLLTSSLLCTSILAAGCAVEVKEQPAPVVKPERKVDINVDTPGGDVDIKKP